MFNYSTTQYRNHTKNISTIKSDKLNYQYTIISNRSYVSLRFCCILIYQTRIQKTYCIISSFLYLC